MTLYFRIWHVISYIDEDLLIFQAGFFWGALPILGPASQLRGLFPAKMSPARWLSRRCGVGPLKVSEPRRRSAEDRHRRCCLETLSCNMRECTDTLMHSG